MEAECAAPLNPPRASGARIGRSTAAERWSGGGRVYVAGRVAPCMPRRLAGEGSRDAHRERIRRDRFQAKPPRRSTLAGRWCGLRAACGSETGVRKTTTIRQG
jgi:hypothetical protein